MGEVLLIVEDSVLFRQVLKAFLQKSFPSLTVIEVDDVPAGWKAAVEHAPAVIFMDINLPSGSGLDLTRRIKKELSGATVVVCTIDNNPAYRRVAFENGASHFVPKGELRPDWLQEVVRVALEAATAV